jgi:lysine biosynthesis protein LysW
MHGKSKKGKNGLAATCPACGYHIRLKKLPRRGQFITCLACDSMLAVARLSPLKLEWAFEEPFENGHNRSRHFVENVDGQAGEWFDGDDYDEFKGDPDLQEGN